MRKKLILFLDSGDTLIDESTERRRLDRVVYRAELIEGAGETLRTLREEGFTIAMVADGREQSFRNMFEQHGLSDCFDVRSISERVGVQKPDARMFQTAMDLLGLGDADRGRVLMVGNNMRKDIAGANRFGIRSALLTWSPRYKMTSDVPDEQPTYRIATPLELLPLARALEAEL